jgi:hypothetical protein
MLFFRGFGEEDSWKNMKQKINLMTLSLSREITFNQKFWTICHGRLFLSTNSWLQQKNTTSVKVKWIVKSEEKMLICNLNKDILMRGRGESYKYGTEGPG